MCRLVGPAPVLGDNVDQTDDVGVELVEALGGDPVLPSRDGATTCPKLDLRGDYGRPPVMVMLCGTAHPIMPTRAKE